MRLPEYNEDLLRDYYDRDLAAVKLIEPTIWQSPSYQYFWYKTKSKLLDCLLGVLKSMAPRAGAFRILDVGCHCGTDLLMLRRHLKLNGFAAELYGCDISAAKIKLARERAGELNFGECHFHVDNAETLQDTTGYFDVIVSSEVIEHLPDPGKMIASMSKHLERGGFLILTTPTVTRTAYLFTKYLFRVVERRSRQYEDFIWNEATKNLTGIGHISEMPVCEVINILRKNGLQLTKMQRGFLTYGGEGWDRAPFLFSLLLAFDKFMDMLYRPMSVFPFLQGMTFSQNAVYLAQKTASASPVIHR